MDTLRESAEAGNVDPPLGFRLAVDGQYVVGSREGYVREYAYTFVVGLLEAADSVLHGERYVLDFYLDALYLVFEPVEETNQVDVWFCYSMEEVETPAKRGEGSPSKHAMADVDSLVAGALATGEQYRDVVLDADPSLEPEIDELRRVLGAVRSRVDERD